MEKNIVLIGFMGTGKSTVGVKIAERLKMNFVDMDREIEKITGMSIKLLFKNHGEVRFRSEEKLMAQKLSKQKNMVIATGGGVVLQEDNIEVLRENGIIICLDADASNIFERVNRKRGTRPLLKKNLTVKDVEDMLAERETFYAGADYRINTSNKDLNQVVNEAIRHIKKTI
ncbi:MAG TPA: shikimate kinase [Syntrophomonadaceae bacterium]|nr:shikimate kinase [Syntrophomonadaceae bacterium]